MELITEPVRYEASPGVARITLADPARRNALGPSLLAGLHRALSQARADASCRAIVLGAEGDSFCSGIDLETVFSTDRPDMGLFEAFVDCLLLIGRSSVPVIACVGATASGGGVGLAAAADLVIAAEPAVFMLPEVIVGMIPAIITPWLLRRLPPSRVRSLTLGTRGISAAEAATFGLVDEVVPSAGLPGAVRRALRRILRSSPEAIAQSKRYFDDAFAEDLERRSRRALDELATWLARPEVVKGARMFAEGQSPPWFSL